MGRSSSMTTPPPPPPPIPPPTLPRFCRHCGREMIETKEPGLFVTRTGEREIQRWASCPRFFRSWRNLWLGGFHDSVSLDHALLRRKYR